MDIFMGWISIVGRFLKAVFAWLRPAPPRNPKRLRRELTLRTPTHELTYKSDKEFWPSDRK